jgi:hypothetical protein
MDQNDDLGTVTVDKVLQTNRTSLNDPCLHGILRRLVICCIVIDVMPNRLRKRAAALYGVPYQTYLKEAALRQAIADLKDLQAVAPGSSLK